MKNWAVAEWGVGGARHGQGAHLVAQPVAGLVLDRVAGGLLGHVGGEAAALDHEAGDHPVKDGAVEEAVVHVLHEVGHGLGGLVGEQFDDDGALAGFDADFGVVVIGHCEAS